MTIQEIKDANMKTLWDRVRELKGIETDSARIESRACRERAIELDELLYEQQDEFENRGL